VPFVSRCRKTPADLLGKALAELHRTLPDRLMTDLDAAGRQHLLDHPQAQRETEVQPHGMADHLSWKAMTGIARITRRFHPSRMAPCGHRRVNLTVPRAAKPRRFANMYPLSSASQLLHAPANPQNSLTGHGCFTSSILRWRYCSRTVGCMQISFGLLTISWPKRPFRISHVASA